MSKQSSNTALLEKTYRALTEGDREELERLIAPDARIHIPGRNTVSGEYQGPEAMLVFFQRLASLTEATYHRELLDRLAGESHAAALVHVSSRHAGRVLDMRLVFVITIEGDRVTDLRSYFADQAAWDTFWSDQMLTGTPLPTFQPPRNPIDP